MSEQNFLPKTPSLEETLQEYEARLMATCPFHDSRLNDHSEDELFEDLGLQLMLEGFDEQARTSKDSETGEIINLDDETFELLLKAKKSV